MDGSDVLETEIFDNTEHIAEEPIAPGALFLVKVLHCSETELCRNKDALEIQPGDLVVCPTKYGDDLCRVLGPVAERNAGAWKEVQSVVRVASDEDVARYEMNLDDEVEAISICRGKVEKHGLDMKLVSAHFVLGEPKLLFFFTADARVDFRELVKDLVSHFKMRIELRQIGVRDESRVLGGTGVCGRPFCCHGLTDKLKPVSIKMAKVQNLSLNSMKISGPCGRLLCCLSYEYDFYREEKRTLPDEGTRLTFDGTAFRVCEVNLLSRQVKMNGEDGRFLSIPATRFSWDQGKQRWSVAPAEEEELD